LIPSSLNITVSELHAFTFFVNSISYVKNHHFETFFRVAVVASNNVHATVGNFAVVEDNMRVTSQ
jgi:hypothetical protein